jgi:hypothetical protein
VLWTTTLGMFVGRLEFFIIVVSLMKIVRDSFAMLRYKLARRSKFIENIPEIQNPRSKMP